MKVSKRKHSRKSHKHSRKCNCKQCDRYYNRSNKRHRHRRSRNKKQNNTLKLNKPSPEIAYSNDISNKMVEVVLNKNNNKSYDDAAGNIIPGLRNI